MHKVFEDIGRGYFYSESGAESDGDSSYEGNSGANDTSEHDNLNIKHSLSDKGLHFLHLNARSALPKLGEIRRLAHDSGAAVLGLTETWYDESIGDSEIEINGVPLHSQ